MSRPALLLGSLHTFLLIPIKINRNRSKPHQRPIPIIKPRSLLSEISLHMLELSCRNRDIPAQSDRVLSASVVEAVVEPHVEHVSRVFGHVLEAVED